MRSTYFGGTRYVVKQPTFRLGTILSQHFIHPFCQELSLPDYSPRQHSVIMAPADESASTAQRRGEGEKASRRDHSLTHPHFQAGENYRFHGRGSHRNAKTEAHAGASSTQLAPNPGHHSPVISFPPPAGILYSADSYNSGKKQITSSRRNCGGRPKIPRKRGENVNEQLGVHW